MIKHELTRQLKNKLVVKLELSNRLAVERGVQVAIFDSNYEEPKVIEQTVNFEYLELVVLAERLHRQFLDVIQLELDLRSIRDINNVQALILHNIGDAEMTVSELMWRGCYLGSNVSYSLKKLTETGYIVQERSAHDKRVIMVRLSEKGAELCTILKNMNARHVEALSQGNLKSEDIATCGRTLRGLQQFWSRSVEPGLLGGMVTAVA